MVWNRRLPPSSPVANVFLLAEVALWCTPFRLIPESLVVSTVTAIRGAVGRGMDVIRTAPVSGMRALSGAAAGQGYNLAGQIVNLLQQVSGVGGLGDWCSGGKRGDFRNLVSQL
jgi:hypothetical protein